MKEPIKKECFRTYYNKGGSIVVYNNKYGSFIGSARCHPDDKDKMSEITGCTIAEKRADLKYYKERLKLLKREYKAFLTFFHSLSETEWNHINKKAINKIAEYETRIAEYEGAIAKTEDDIRQYIRIKDMVAEKVNGQNS